MSKTDRKGILGEISSWLKLLGLIVLVAESVIILAMSTSPPGHPMNTWYPLLMLLFLVIIVAGLFIDRHQKRRTDETLKLSLGDREVVVNTSQVTVPEAKPESAGQKTYSDSEKGFSFELPSSQGWAKPLHLSCAEMFVRLGLVADVAGFESFRSNASVIPLGKMLMESFNILVEYKEPVAGIITDQTSNSVIDSVIGRIVRMLQEQGEEAPSEDEIVQVRRDMLLQNYNISAFKIQNVFAVHGYDKTLAANSPVTPTLANVFVMITSGNKATIDKLVSNESSILWGTKQTLTNVKIGESVRELTTYSMNALFENDRYIFELNVSFSPQTDAPIFVWEELQKMITSFKVAAG